MKDFDRLEVKRNESTETEPLSVIRVIGRHVKDKREESVTMEILQIILSHHSQIL